MSERRAPYGPQAPRSLEVRLIGPPADVEAVAAVLRQAYGFLSESPDRPAQKKPGQVRRYIEIILPPGAYDQPSLIEVDSTWAVRYE